jgi:hypothetical protein
MSDRPIDEFEGRRCPYCGGADQHVAGCWLEDKPHVYGIDQAKVDWPATIKLNVRAKP